MEVGLFFIFFYNIDISELVFSFLVVSVSRIALHGYFRLNVSSLSFVIRLDYNNRFLTQ